MVGCCVDLVSYCKAAVKFFRRYHRATVLLTISFVLLFLFVYSPVGYGSIYAPCQLLSVADDDESHSGAGHVTFGHLAIDFGRGIRLRLFAGVFDQSPNASVGHNSVKLSAVIGRTLPAHAPYRLTTEPPDQLGLVFLETGVRLTVRWLYDSCYRIAWQTSCSGHLRDSIRLSGAHWYGGPTVLEPRWPMSDLRRSGMEALVTGDVYRDYYGGVVERFWISSEGAVVHVDYDVPLFVSVNSNDDRNLDIEARSLLQCDCGIKAIA